MKSTQKNESAWRLKWMLKLYNYFHLIFRRSHKEFILHFFLFWKKKKREIKKDKTFQSKKEKTNLTQLENMKISSGFEVFFYPSIIFFEHKKFTWNVKIVHKGKKGVKMENVPASKMKNNYQVINSIRSRRLNSHWT